MTSKAFIDKFTNEIAGLILENKRVDNVKRIGAKGDIIEEITADLFVRYFPSRCGFGKGEIHDSLGNQSKEVDIIIFDKDGIPPICHSSKNKNENIVKGFFPVESLWYAIEIKKTLNNTELKDAIENMKSVSELKSRLRNPVRMLFAHGSDLKGCDIKKEFDRYKRADSEWNKNPAIHVICIIGKGYLFAQFATRKKDNKHVLLWKYINSQNNHFEVACCLSGMINTITGQAFGLYLFDENNISILEEIELLL